MTGTNDWRRWVRHDIEAVPPMGGYAAKRCPVRTQLDVLEPGDQAGVSAFRRSLADRGIAFEAEVVDALDVAELEEELATREEREEATLAAMRDGLEVITGGRLPTDLEGRRVGAPDLLVRVGAEPVDGRWRYLPVDIKAHGMVRAGSGADVVTQPLDDLAAPADDAATEPDGRRDGTARGDLLQLAHYHRMLEACGHATTGTPWGAIIGAEEQAVWYRLDEPLWQTPTSDPDATSKRRSSLDVYDFEFAFRLDIAAVAVEHRDDPSVDLLVEPMHCGECAECPWRNHCFPQLEERGDVSLLPRVTYDDWRALRDAGLGAIEDLAESTGEVDGIANGKLAELRLQATARLAEAPVTIRPGRHVDVPSADVEVDVDMENVAEGAYLWGATVTVRRDEVDGIESGHHAFSTWASPLDDAAAGDVFDQFWAWLTDLRARCEQQGASFVAFCWSQAAENRFLRAGADVTGRRDEVDAFIASDLWVDLLAWFKDTFATGHGNGLKVVADLLGFSWRDDDPGGAASMTWYADAIGDDPETAETARQRLIDYNEDDVRATVRVREAVRELFAS